MKHVIEAVRHLTVRFVYETDDDEYESKAEEVKQAIVEGLIDPFDGTHDTVADVTNVCDRLEPNSWVQLANSEPAANRIDVSSLQTVSAVEMLCKLSATAKEQLAKQDNEE